MSTVYCTHVIRYFILLARSCASTNDCTYMRVYLITVQLFNPLVLCYTQYRTTPTNTDFLKLICTFLQFYLHNTF